MMRVLDLFSGIGGFSLGLERAGGFETVAFCEIEAFPRAVLAKHWPKVLCYDDVRTLTAERLAADGIAVDVICGGFPCQDISLSGNLAGINEGTRSGLWSEIARLVGELGPRFVIVENVTNLLSGPAGRPGEWFGKILGDLAALGYDAEWHSILASAVGAQHHRDRVWIVAYPNKTHSIGKRIPGRLAPKHVWPGDGGEVVADALRNGQQGLRQFVEPFYSAPAINRQTIDAFYGRFASQWQIEPTLGRVADGVPNRSHRLAALGNAVVPQIPEMIGNAILARIKEATP